jgi:hypothetical protein
MPAFAGLTGPNIMKGALPFGKVLICRGAESGRKSHCALHKHRLTIMLQCTIFGPSVEAPPLVRPGEAKEEAKMSTFDIQGSARTTSMSR